MITPPDYPHFCLSCCCGRAYLVTLATSLEDLSHTEVHHQGALIVQYGHLHHQHSQTEDAHSLDPATKIVGATIVEMVEVIHLMTVESPDLPVSEVTTPNHLKVRYIQFSNHTHLSLSFIIFYHGHFTL